MGNSPIRVRITGEFPEKGEEGWLIPDHFLDMGNVYAGIILDNDDVLNYYRTDEYEVIT